MFLPFSDPNQQVTSLSNKQQNKKIYTKKKKNPFLVLLPFSSLNKQQSKIEDTKGGVEYQKIEKDQTDLTALEGEAETETGSGPTAVEEGFGLRGA